MLKLIDSSTAVTAVQAPTIESRDNTPQRLAKRASNNDLSQANNSSTPIKLKQYNLADFEKLRIIGKGSFGSVHLVKHSLTGSMHAMKII